MTFKRRSITVFAALLLAFASLFGISAFAANNIEGDFSLAASGENVTITSAEILENYLGVSLSASEAEFFEKISASGALETVEISYNRIINTDKVSLKYEDGTLYIEALRYEYVGVNGKTFVWIPESANVGSREISFYEVGGVYFGELACAEPEKDASITVSYKAEAAVSGSDINEIINLYRNSAKYAYEKGNYEAYLIEKKLYDDAKARYEKYLSDVDEYERLLYAFNNYENETLVKYYEDLAKYQSYEVDKKEYDEKMEKYNAYMSEYSKIEKQLNGVKLIDVPMTMGRTLYAAVMGNTVDQVLENESAIVAAGADKEAVRLAGIATERVRALMKGFKSCKTDLEKYMYYTANYDNLCESFLLLTQTLDALYTTNVRMFLVAKDKNEKYVILVAQLALVTNALIDGPVRNYYGNVSYTPTWKFDNKTISQILENKKYFVDDNTAYPIEIPPEVKKPDDLVEVKKPVFPKEPDKPIMPIPVSDPGVAPKVTENPDLTLDQQGIVEIYKALDAEYRESLAKSFENGRLPVERAESDVSGMTLTLSTVLNKRYGTETVNVSFKRLDGSYKSVTVDKNSPVVCDADVPLSYQDVNSDTWVLKAWRPENDIEREIDFLLGFDTDTVLVPVYEHYYDIKWIINGKEYSKSVSALESAICPVNPSISDDGNMYYVFSGWEDENGNNVGIDIGKPTRDATYRATFEKKYIVPLTNTKGADITYGDGIVICDASKHYSSENINVAEAVKRAASNQSGLLIKLNAGTLKFAFSEVLDLASAGINDIGIAYSGGASTEDNYMVKARDKGGNSVFMTVQLTVKSRAESTEKYKLFKTPHGAEKSYVKYIFDKNEISFEAETEIPYVFRPEYSVRVAPNTLVDVNVSNTLAERLEEITYTVVPKDGVEILEILIEDSDGTPVSVTANKTGDGGSFWVREKDISISVMARYKTYTVIFKANGKNIYQTTAIHGSEITPPMPPKISDDGAYSYEFAGWNTEITPVTCDITYEAVYEKTPLPEKEETRGLKLSPQLKKLFYIAIAAFAFFIVILSLITIVITKKLRRRKARRNGFFTYAEYKASKAVKRIENKIKKLKEKLESDGEGAAKYCNALKKAEVKCAKAKEKLTNSKEISARKQDKEASEN